MSGIADAFAVPAELPALCWFMADALGQVNRHFTPINPAGPNAEDALLMWSCCVQRLEQLGIKRPVAT